MPHLDPDLLMLIALEEHPADADTTAHMQQCPRCREDLAAARTVAGLARGAGKLRDLPAPPESVWAGIAQAAFAGSGGDTPDAPTRNSRDRTVQPARPAASRPAGPVVGRAGTTPPRAGRSRRRGLVRLALVAVVAALAGVVGTAGVQWLSGRSGDRVVAHADLKPQAAAPPGAHGSVDVIDTGHGLQLRLSLSGMPAPRGYYTVWLYDGAAAMVPVGSPGPAPLNVPAAAGDLDMFHIVDVSAQDVGQQQHGTSMLQGTLRR